MKPTAAQEHVQPYRQHVLNVSLSRAEMTGPSLLGDVSVTHNWERASSVYCCRSQHFCRPRELRYGHGQLSPDLASKWVTLDRDEATNAFLENCLAGHLGPRLLDICKLAPLRILRWYFSATDANALLGRGEMFVLSSDQAQRLLGAGTSGVLLDIGAGAGHTTSELAQLFDQVIATEVSGPMVTKLEARGFPVLQGSDLSGLQEQLVDAICKDFCSSVISPCRV